MAPPVKASRIETVKRRPMTGKKYLSYDRVSYDEDKKKTRRMMEAVEYSWCFFFFLYIIPDKKLYSCQAEQSITRTDYSLTKDDNIQGENSSYDETWWKGKCWQDEQWKARKHIMTREVEQGNYGTDKWQRPVIQFRQALYSSCNVSSPAPRILSILRVARTYYAEAHSSVRGVFRNIPKTGERSKLP